MIRWKQFNRLICLAVLVGCLGGSALAGSIKLMPASLTGGVCSVAWLAERRTDGWVLALRVTCPRLRLTGIDRKF